MKRLRRWWQARGERRSTKIEVMRRDLNRLTVEEWRSDPGWVATGASVLHDSKLRMMLDVVANSAPGNEVLPLGTSTQDRLVAQARQEGYVMALANLEALGVEKPIQRAVEALFDPPERREAQL